MSTTMRQAQLLITAGEPAGIGPELVVKVVHEAFDMPITVVGDPDLFQQRAETINLPIELNLVTPHHDNLRTGAGVLNVIPEALNVPSQPGVLEQKNAGYVLKTLQIAHDLCTSKTFDGVVTGPVQKSIINDAGIPFSGHTEFFADRCKVKKVVMMLATEGLRVALASTHLPLKDVASYITQTNLHEVIDILVQELQTKFALQKPTILVAGLNPHAGEGGHLGSEEIETIIPVLSRYANASVNLIGPLPADTLFTPKYLDKADAVLAMYHDQGLPVLKYKGFGNAVNITLGLPYIRTSVDHGTALDLAGKGSAEASSLITALHHATSLANNTRSI